MKPVFILLIMLTAVFAQVEKPEHIQSIGFFTVDGNIYNGDGSEFLMRGVNQNHFWGNEAKNLNAMTAIPNSHANVVRVVMSNGDWQKQSRTPSKKRALVEKYIDLGLIPMVELHDGTCEASPTFIEDIVDEWTHPDNVDWLNEYEEYVILNIANEWGPGDTDEDWQVWRDTYKTAITRIRNAGINNMIVVDAPKCGQGPRALEVYGRDVIEHDPQKNVVLSIHFYGWWRTMDRVGDVDAPNQNDPPWLIEWELQSMLDLGLPIIVGEFGWIEHDAVNYDTKTMIKFCQEKGIGWLAWNWVNNGGALDMVKNWEYDSDADLTEYGDLLINHPLYGMRATSRQATVFGAPNEKPQVTLTLADSVVDKGGSLEISVSTSDADGQVTQIDLYINDRLVEQLAGDALRYTWEAVPRGAHTIYAAARDDAGAIGSSRVDTLQVGFRPQTRKALFLVGNTDLHAGDLVVRQRLNMLGYAVVTVNDDDVTTDDFAGMDMILISSSIIPTRVRQLSFETPTPILCWETRAYYLLGWTGRANNVDIGQTDATQLDIVLPAHPATPEMRSIPLFDKPMDAGWGVPGDSADVLAVAPGEKRQPGVFIYETDDELYNGSLAPAARVGLFFYHTSTEHLNIAAWSFFDEIVDYVQALPTGVEKNQDVIVPNSIRLFPNTPNPFNPRTTLRYQLAEPASVRLDIFDVNGRRVRTLIDGTQMNGEHSVKWDSRDEQGRSVASGAYVYQLSIQNKNNKTHRSGKMLLLR